MIEHIELLVEEPSAEAALRVLLPRFLDDVSFEVYTHQGKADLLGKLPSRLNAYSKWLPENWRIIVLIDRDNDDCRVLKRRIETIAADAGLRTPSRKNHSGRFDVVNRIAIEELEAWYFGDWDAVRQAYPRLKATIPQTSGYRDPDAILGGTWEAFERLLQSAGYMKGGLLKIEAARSIGEHMRPDRNTSASFRCFWRALTT